MIVWDQAAAIRFLRPGRSTLYGTFRLEAGTVTEIASEARAAGRITRDFQAELVDGEGQVCVACTKTIHIRCKSAVRP